MKPPPAVFCFQIKGRQDGRLYDRNSTQIIGRLLWLVGDGVVRTGRLAQKTALGSSCGKSSTNSFVESRSIW